MSAPDFAVDIFQNEFLQPGAREVNAIVTVTSAGSVSAALQPAQSAAEIVIIDCSGSMYGEKIAQAREATCVAVDAIRDGVAFAVIQGTDEATVVYPDRPFMEHPGQGDMAIASNGTRREAKAAVRRLSVSGGTAIGTWLRLTRELFQTREDVLRHAILLTDGYNLERRRRFEAEIARCEGVFRCDCRGVGTDWRVEELRKISTALLGTVDIVPDPAGLAADFDAMMRASMAKQVADISLQVWTPRHARVRFLKQVAPTVEDLTGRRATVTEQAGDYPTGAWAAESRDYHVCLDVQPGAVGGPEMLAARVGLACSTPGGPQTLGKGLVKAIWTDDEALSARMSRQVAHYSGQAELAQAIQEGLAARSKGDQKTAAARFGRALELADQSGNADTGALLAKMVDKDPATGVVRLKGSVAAADAMALDTRSTKTVRVKK